MASDGVKGEYSKIKLSVSRDGQGISKMVQ